MTYNLVNLFDINTQPFDGIADEFTEEEYNQFLKHVWFGWLYVTYYMELGASIIYSNLSEKIEKTEYYTDKKNLIEFFEKSSKEERTHSLIFEKILIDLVDNFVPIADTKEYVEGVKYYFKDHTLLEELVEFAANEVALLIPTSAFYKQTNNPIKKQLLSTLLADESQHTQIILKALSTAFIDAAQEEKDRVWATFINFCSQRRYFAYPIVVDHLQTITQDTDKQMDMFNKIYNTKWQIECSNFALRKFYQIVEIIHPEITFEEFKKITQPTHPLVADETVDLSCFSLYNI